MAEDTSTSSIHSIERERERERVAKNATADSIPMERASSASRQTNLPGNMGAAPGRALSFVQNIDFRSPDDIDDRQTPFQSEVGIDSVHVSNPG